MPVDVRLGPIGPGSIAATTFVLVERGAARRPDLAERLPAVTRLAFREGLPPVRIGRHGDVIHVGDDDLAPATAADLTITAPLAALLANLTVPLKAGFPHPLKPEGRAVLKAVADGTVLLDGRVSEALTLLRLLSVRG